MIGPIGLSGQMQTELESRSPQAMDRPRLGGPKITRRAFGGIRVPELSQCELSSGIVYAAGIGGVCSNLTGQSCVWARCALTAGGSERSEGNLVGKG